MGLEKYYGKFKIQKTIFIVGKKMPATGTLEQ
jgi:hypothetical protein